MASEDTMTIHSSIHEDEDDDDDHQHQQDRSYSLSRLSMCTNSSKHSMYDFDVDDEVGISMTMARLSIECSDGDADEELSDDKELVKGISGVLSDSDKEPGCFSLPATPPRRRTRRSSLTELIGSKEYASEGEARIRRKSRKNSRRRIVRETGLERGIEKNSNSNNFNGESECLMITRAKGGRRSLCMDLEEVKACRDLGFELEHEKMIEIPSRISISGSTVETSSGGNSPIANWRISSPGDDPRDVKARLKVWAQAVALASASRLVS